MLQNKEKGVDIPVEMIESALSNKWKILILANLMDNKLRFNELKRSIEGISAKVLTENLRKLEEAELVNRKVIPEIPVKVEYELTKYGLSLYPIFYEMSRWNKENLQKEVTKSKLVI